MIPTDAMLQSGRADRIVETLLELPATTGAGGSAKSEEA
ncbi:MAG: hypothetical protein ACJATR_000466 [Halopseudomonas sp.]|jgi:hypothetical protein